MAEESQRRASFLAEATQVMASSLDVDTILKGAAGLVVPFLADYGADRAGATRTARPARSAPPRWPAGTRTWASTRRASRRCSTKEIARVVERATARTHADRAGAPGLRRRHPPRARSTRFPLVTRGRHAARCVLALGPSGALASRAPTCALAENLAGRAASALENCLLYEEIQHADRRKNEFLATLSHELRNPLAPMRAGAAHARAADASIRDSAAPLLETMDRQVGQMTRLVEDLLDISRITRGSDRAAPRAARRRRRGARRARVVPGPLEVRAATRSRCKLPEEPLYVVADRVRLQQILENLILNACQVHRARRAHRGERASRRSGKS